jgi:hypothetical protein
MKKLGVFFDASLSARIDIGLDPRFPKLRIEAGIPDMSLFFRKKTNGTTGT